MKLLTLRTPWLFTCLLAGTAFSSSQTPPSSGPFGQVKQNLYQASWLAKSLVNDINNEVAYIQSGGQGEGEGNPECPFCEDEGPANENDNVVVQHLLVFASRAQEIARLASFAAQQPPGTMQDSASQACQLANNTLNAIPAARATLDWAPLGVARPSTFDSTEGKTYPNKIPAARLF